MHRAALTPRETKPHALCCFAALILGAPLGAQHEAPQPSSEKGAPQTGQYFGNPAAITQGQTLFVTVCSGCHGPNGEGGRGPSLVDSSDARRAANRELFNLIQKGIPGTRHAAVLVARGTDLETGRVRAQPDRLRL